ncbi:nitrogen regulation protein NR(II) [Verrucomicrobiota bacterium]
MALDSYIAALESGEGFLLKSLVEGVHLARAGDDVIISANRRLEEMFGYEPGEIVGKHAAILNAPSGNGGEGIPEEARQALEAVGSWRGRMKHVRKDGAEFWCHTGVSTFEHPEHGKVVLSLHVDITRHLESQERETELRERLARAECMESLGILAGGVAHDLNNVIGPTVSLATFLAEDLERLPADTGVDLGDMKESVELIRTSALRAMRTIGDLVTMGRRGTHEFVPVDINGAVNDFLESPEMRDIGNRYPEVTVDAVLAVGKTVIRGVESQLQRVVLNLVLNGVEAIEGEGKVIVKTSCKTLKARVNAYETVEPGEYIVLEVSDTGRGVDAADVNRIFEPFVSLNKKRDKRSGSGLGLSVVRGIVKDHDGFIDVTSGIEKGTTFSLYFPVSPGSGRQQPGTDRSLRPGSPGTRW